MANARSAWGIDIGNRALKAIKLEREGETLRVVDFEIIEHEQVLSKAGDNRESLIQSALANFVQRHPDRSTPVAISVSGQTSFARFVKLPPVEPKKIPEIVKFEAIQQIPFPLEDVEWSYQLFQQPDSPDVEVGIFAIRKELIAEHIRHFTEVDLNVQYVQMNPLAVYNAMQHDGRLQNTTMVIDLGAENTDLIIAEGGSIWMRSIPIGGNHFTETLVKSFKLDFAKAEELKRNAATSKYAKQIFQAMRPVFSELSSEIQRSIGFYASVHRDSRISKIIGIGSTFRMPGLQKYLQQNLQLDVERLDSVTAALPVDGKLATSFNENLLSVISAYGLALQAMGEGKIVSSLLPERIRREKMWRVKTKWFAAASLLFVLGTAVAGGTYYNSIEWPYQANEEKRRTIDTVMKQAEQLSSAWSEIENKGSMDRQRILNVRSLDSYRNLWSNLLVDIYQALPTPGDLSDPAKLEAMLKVPRGQREQLSVDSVVATWIPDMGPVLADPNFRLLAGSIPQLGGGIPQGRGDKAGGARGYLVTIRGTTPNSNAYDLVARTLVKRMAAHTAEEMDKNNAQVAVQRGYYVAKATLVSANQIRQNGLRMSELHRAYTEMLRLRPKPVEPAAGPVKNGTDGSPDAAAAPAPVAVPAAVSADEAFKDRLTGEDVRDDYEFVALFAVVLDPAPKAK